MSWAVKSHISRSVKDDHLVSVVEEHRQHYVLSGGARGAVKVDKDLGAEVAFRHKDWDYFQKKYLSASRRQV